MQLFRSLVTLLGAMLLSVTLVVSAQEPPTQPMPQDQLDALLAPIALYPDELLTQVLMASTYPLEVVEAARFVKANPVLTGQALDDALKDKTWDPSVLSLVPFPQVLDMMNDKLEWTQRLGDAFLADEAAVMRTVQMLRQRAEQAGNLQSNQQQRVFAEDRNIVIEPAQPDYVYVPVYNPMVIYGPWWAPAYQPWYWYPPPIWGYPPAPPWWGFTAGFFWGSAWAVHRSYWGWARPNWRSNNVHINVNNNYYWANRPQYRDRYPNGTGNWTHVPEHRKGVAYRDAATYNKYRPTNPTAVQTRESYRGNPSRYSTLPGGNAGSPTNRPMPTAPAVAQPGTRPASPALAQPSTRPSSPPLAQPSMRPATPPLAQPSPGATLTQPSARPTGTVDQYGSREARDRTSRTPQVPSIPRSTPAFQTQPRPQVQMESNRGQASRQQMYAPPVTNRGQPSQPQTNRGQPSQPQANQPRQGNPAGGGSPQGRSR